MAQGDESEERRGLRAERHVDRADAFLDFFLGLLRADILAPEIGMAPGMGADRVTARGDLLQNFRVIGRVLADDEECRLHALLGQCRQNLRRCRPRAVVEGEQNLLVTQEVVLLEMLEAETGTAGGVDLNSAGDPERVRVLALGAGSRSLRESGAARQRCGNQDSAGERVAHVGPPHEERGPRRPAWQTYGMESLTCHKSQRILPPIPVGIGDYGYL